ncbi:hypothetical protein KP509_1Z223600 [Ceratopteris richardii]|nr:hypothetical protein KP509_1Z223600 [Ceratopteris richardii]
MARVTASLNSVVVTITLLLASVIVLEGVVTPTRAEIWCVARPGLSDMVLSRLVHELCMEGEAASEDLVHDCGPIVPGDRCYLPNTPYAHASYVINASWQRLNSRGRHVPCDFAGRAMLTTHNPSTSPACQYKGLP